MNSHVAKAMRDKQESGEKKRKFLAFLFIIFVWFIFANPYFIKHLVPFPAQYMDSFFTPWNVYPQYQIGVKNNALSDVANEIYPWKHFTIEMLKTGNVPFWNPYSFSGTPHLANDQSAVLSPFNLLFFMLPFIDAWSLLILLQPLLAGIFTYLFLRALRISVIGSLLASITFMFCGFIVVWMPYGTMAVAIAFLPIVLFAIERSSSSKRTNVASLFLLSVSIAISVFSGHFQISFYLILYSFIFLLFKFFTNESKKKFVWIFLFYILGIGIASLQIIPTLQAYSQSFRGNLFSTSGGIPVQYLITMIAPDFFGNPTTRNDWFGFYAEWSSFIGIIPLSLAIIAVFSQSFFNLRLSPHSAPSLAKRAGVIYHTRLILFFFIAGLASLMLALNTPLQGLLTLLRIPILSTSIPSRIIVLFSFSFCVLAGFGFDVLKEHLEKMTMKRVFFVFFGIGSVILLVWISLLLFHLLPKDKMVLAAKNFVLPSVLFFLFVGLIVLSFFSKKIAGEGRSGLILKRTVVWALLIFTILDSLRFAMKWMPFDPISFVYPSIPVVSAMQKTIGSGRVFGDFGAYIDTYYHLPAIEGYDPLYNQRYGELLASAANGRLTEPEKSIVRLNRQAKYADRILDLLGVTLIYHQISYTNQPWAFPVWAEENKYSRIYQDDKFQLYRNKTALPRVKIFYTYDVLANKAQEIKHFYDDTFDFRNTLLLEQNPAGLTPNAEGIGQAKIVSYRAEQVVISVMSDRPGLLFLSDTYYPAWRVTVNGRDETIYRADYALRAVKVPTGKSLVKFFYNGLL